MNAPGAVPALLVRAAQLARRSPLADATGWITLTLDQLLGRPLHTITHTAYTVDPRDAEPRVYRVQLLTPARCPAPLTPPCYTVVAR